MCSLTEKEVIDFLITSAKKYDEVSPRCVIMTRTQSKNSITRDVRFALIVSSDNIVLIDGINKDLLELPVVHFIGSEKNLQSDMEIEYLYFDAQIMAKIK